MIADQTIDQALIELKRTEKALLALRDERKAELKYCPKTSCARYWKKGQFPEAQCPICCTHYARSVAGPRLHAAVKRASLDLTRKLADLRQGR